ncbi:MAG: dimethylsulfoniopropionate demethylase [Alphaproteobacteria bacterium]
MTDNLFYQNPLVFPSCHVKRSHFFLRTQQGGAKQYAIYNNMLLSTTFQSIADDCRHLKQYVQLWDVSGQRQVEIKGRDAAKLVQYMTPRNIGKCAVGQCMYALLCDKDGGIVNDPVIIKLKEDHFWLSIANSDVELWARGLALGGGYDVEVAMPDVSPIAVQGPKSDDLLEKIFGKMVRAIRPFRFEYVPFMGHNFLLARSGWSKQGGFEIYVDNPTIGLKLWDEIMHIGKDFNIHLGSPNLIERITSGLLSYRSDMDLTTNPFEAGLEKFCDIDGDHDYFAKTALQNIKRQKNGVQRQIRPLKFDSEIPTCSIPWQVFADKDNHNGKQVGRVTSATTSHETGGGIAIAMIDSTHWQVGTRLMVETPDGLKTASVTSFPIQ